MNELPRRRRLGLKKELLLALMPTATILLVLAMVAAIVVMVMLDTMHPPAVATALSFGLRAGDESNLVLFGLAVGITALLVVLQYSALWMLRRTDRS